MLDRFKRKPQQPDKATAQTEREAGRAAYERGDDRAALAAFERSIDADPRSAWTWLFLAQVQLRLGDRDASYAAVRRALELKPDESSASWHLIELLEADGRADEAKARSVALCEAHPAERRDPPAWDRDAGPSRRPSGRSRARRSRADRSVAGRGARGRARCRSRCRGSDRGGGGAHASSPPRGVPRGDGRPREPALVAGPSARSLDLVRDLRPVDVGSSLLVKLGRSLRAKGELEAAKDAYKAAASVDPEQGRAGYWAEVVEGEWVRTSGRWHATPSRVVAFEGVPGRVLHIVTRSRPWAQVGYSIRTQYVAKGQQAVGLEPHIATQYGFPLTVGVEDAPTSAPRRIRPAPSLPTGRWAGPCTRGRSAHGRTRVPRHSASRGSSGRPPGSLGLPERAALALRLGELFDIPVVYEVRGFWEVVARPDRPRRGRRHVSLAPGARHRVHGARGRDRHAVGGHGRRDRRAWDRPSEDHARPQRGRR